MSLPRKLRDPKKTSHPLSKPLKKLPVKKKNTKAKKSTAISIDVAGAKKSLASIIELEKRKLSHSTPDKMPHDIKPMLATLVDEPFNDESWQFELKLDGYRCLSYLKIFPILKSNGNLTSFSSSLSQSCWISDCNLSIGL